MAALGKLLTDLLTLSGYDLSSPDVQALLVSDVDVPDTVASSLKTGLLTEESAKNNPTVKKHFTAQALNTVDAELEDYIARYAGFTDADKADFKAEKSSYKKLGLVLNKVQEAEGKKQAPADSDAVVTLKSEVAKLNAKLAADSAAHQAALADAGNAAANELLAHAMRQELASKDYANTKVDKAVNVQLAELVVNGELSAKGIKVIRGANGEPKLVQANSPELDYMVENKAVSYGALVDSVLGDRKLLNNKPAAPEQGGAPVTHIPTSGADGKLPAEAANFYAQQLAAFG
jgi:hypothetical protein